MMTSILEIDSRINLIQKENFYYTNQIVKFYRKFMILMGQQNSKSKIKGLLVTGEPDAGKSTAVKQFFTVYHSNIKNPGKRDIFYFEIPPRQASKTVLATLCRELGIPDIPRIEKGTSYTTTLFLSKAAAKLRSDVKLLIIDEFQNLFHLTHERRTEILENFNSLINKSHIHIILVGVAGVDSILKNIDDDKGNLRGTFSSRFPEFKIKKFEDGIEFAKILMALNNDMLFKRIDSVDPFYKNDEIRETILRLTNGLLVKIIELLKQTAIKIIEDGLEEKITVEILEETAKDMEMVHDA